MVISVLKNNNKNVIFNLVDNVCEISINNMYYLKYTCKKLNMIKVYKK